MMYYVRKELEAKNTKELLVIAKDSQVVGRHDMKKAQLVDAIEAMQTMKQRAEEVEISAAEADVVYSPVGHAPIVFADNGDDIERRMIEDAKLEEQWEDAKNEERHNPKPKTDYIENVKVGTIVAFKINEAKVLSGKVEEIHKTALVVETKNGVRFTVRKKNIIWVKTGARWPRGVYLALKGENADGEDTRPDSRD